MANYIVQYNLFEDGKFVSECNDQIYVEDTIDGDITETIEATLQPNQTIKLLSALPVPD